MPIYFYTLNVTKNTNCLEINMTSTLEDTEIKFIEEGNEEAAKTLESFETYYLNVISTQGSP